MPVAKGKPSVALEDILKVVSEFDILAHYLNINRVPCAINSPFRRDLRPSVGLYSRDGSRIYFKDFKTSERGGTFDLLGKLWSTDFDGVLQRLHKELPQMVIANGIVHKYQNTGDKKVTFSKDIDLRCRRREWRDYDLEFWGQFGISKEWLEFGNIYPISHIFILDLVDDTSKIIPADKYAYVFVEFKDSTESVKIYQPFNEIYKWRNKHDASVWDLWDQLPESGEELIITSSRKDALTLWENTGIPSVSLQSESYFPKEHVVQQLKDRFKRIYVLYDNDWKKEINTGKEKGQLLANTFNLVYLEIPKEADEKDPSDIVKRYGVETLRKVIKILIKQSKKCQN